MWWGIWYLLNRIENYSTSNWQSDHFSHNMSHRNLRFTVGFQFRWFEVMGTPLISHTRHWDIKIFLHLWDVPYGGSFLEVKNPKNWTPKMVLDPNSILKSHQFVVISHIYTYTLEGYYISNTMFTYRPPVQCDHTLQNVGWNFFQHQ